ncbi:MAG: hypothetical protein ACYC7J_05805 [Syntrophales bacterium]
MKTKALMITMVLFLVATGSGLAQMGGMGHMGMGNGWGYMGTNPNPGVNPGINPTGPGYGYGSGYGHGMGGVGGMISGMMGNTITYGYLTVFNPISTPEEARATVQGFLDLAYSNLAISELWEYGAVYKAELSDTNGAKAFDLLVDKFTGAVSPEMGMSMMMNASYGRGLYRTSPFGANLILTAQQATDIAQTFVGNNALGYVLAVPETYPGYYKFHTTTGAGFGLDIMVNGYSGGVWMNTTLGLPLGKQ